MWTKDHVLIFIRWTHFFHFEHHQWLLPKIYNELLSIGKKYIIQFCTALAMPYFHFVTALAHFLALRRATYETSTVGIGGHVPPPLEISGLAGPPDLKFAPVIDLHDRRWQPKELILRHDLSGPTEHANNPSISTDIAKMPFDTKNDFHEKWIILSCSTSKNWLECQFLSELEHVKILV